MNILILCTANSARSILLEALLNTLGAGRFQVYSAGSQPAGKVHPQSLKLLQDKGYPVDQVRSKSWDEFAGAEAVPMDLVITVCASAAGETCPIWPGAPLRAHWGIPDPTEAAQPDWEEAFEVAYQALHRRAEAFVALSAEQDKAHYATLLKEIGEMI